MRFISFFLLFQLLACKSVLYPWVDRKIEHINDVPFSRPDVLLDRSLGDSNIEHYPIMDAYPSLRTRLGVVSLCDCPTPVQRLDALEEHLGASEKQLGLYIKNDGKTNVTLYGGNKVRKLELLLAQALHSGRKRMLISGTVGSNSAFATALYAKRLGIVPDIHLVPQLPSEHVRRNILMFSRLLAMPIGKLNSPHVQVPENIGTLQYHTSTIDAFVSMLWKGARPRKEKPFFCPPGATSILSTLAYINAMYELEMDIRDGRLPAVPRKIFVPAGSGGTFIGLLIGAKAIPMFHNTEIIAVTAGSKRPVEQYMEHIKNVNDYLNTLTEGRFPTVQISHDEMNSVLDRRFTGGAYGKSTSEAVEAKDLLVQDGIRLEMTYTGKTMARLIHDVRNHQEDTSQLWLYWHTHTAETPFYSSLQHSDVTTRDRETLNRIFTPADWSSYGFDSKNP